MVHVGHVEPKSATGLTGYGPLQQHRDTWPSVTVGCSNDLSVTNCAMLTSGVKRKTSGAFTEGSRWTLTPQHEQRRAKYVAPEAYSTRPESRTEDFRQIRWAIRHACAASLSAWAPNDSADRSISPIAPRSVRLYTPSTMHAIFHQLNAM